MDRDRVLIVIGVLTIVAGIIAITTGESLARHVMFATGGLVALYTLADLYDSETEASE